MATEDCGAKTFDSVMYLTREGLCWTEAEFFVAETDIAAPLPVERVIAIQDGTGKPPPWLAYVVPSLRETP